MHEMNVLDTKGNRIKHFTQWDQFQKIIIEGMLFTSAPQVHFYNKKSPTAHTMESQLLNDKQICVEVPNDLLVEHLPITISLYFLNSDAGGKTELHTMIPVKEKVKPENFLYENNTNVYDFADLIDTLKECKITTQAAKSTISEAETTIETVKTEVNLAVADANNATARAEAAAQGDISGKTVTFQEAVTRANVQSGDSMATALGKLARLYEDLDSHAYNTPVNNLTTTEEGRALDATMGKTLDGKISELNNNMLRIANYSTTVSELPIGTGVEVEFDYSSLNATSVKAVIPYSLGGIPLAFSINGITNTICKLYIRNDTESALSNRTVKIYVFYV